MSRIAIVGACGCAEGQQVGESGSLLVRRSSVSGERGATDPDEASALACSGRARAGTYPWLSRNECWKTRCLTERPVEARADALGDHARAATEEETFRLSERLALPRP